MKRSLLLIIFLLACGAVSAQTTNPATTLAPNTQAQGSNPGNDFNLTIRESTPSAPTVALAGAGAGNVANGVHRVRVEFTTTAGHSNPGAISATVTVVDKTLDGKIAISSIPTGSAFVTGRKVYMTSAGGTVYHLLSNGTIANNTATTLTANDSDATLNAAVAIPSNNTTANSIIEYDGATGAVTIPGYAGGGGAPTDATYITQTANTSLTNEQALSTLGTGILKNTTTTGVLSIASAGDFPTLNQNTTGTAANLSGTPALPNGTTATTQSQADASTKLATTAYVDTGLAGKQAVGSYPTNFAGANVVPKSDGTNLVASRLSDDGTTITVNSGAGATSIGDTAVAGNGTKVAVDDPSGIVTVSASGGDSTFSGDGLTTFAVNSNTIAPISIGVTSVGTEGAPYAKVFIGNGASQDVALTGTFTGARTATFQDVNQTLVGVVASVALTGQTTSTGTTELQCNGGTCPAGLYRVSVYNVITTANGSSTLTTTIAWTDDSGSRTATPAAAISTASTNFSQGVAIVRSASSGIQYTATRSGSTAAWALYITVEKLQ